MSAPREQFPDRVRFNWGFHDAVAECARNARRDTSDHFDPVYAEGYQLGAEAYRVIGTRAVSSENAWRCREDSRRDAARRRKALRDAQPTLQTVRV